MYGIEDFDAFAEFRGAIAAEQGLSEKLLCCRQ